MEVEREQMDTARAKEQCPADFKFGRSPDYKAVCPGGDECHGLDFGPAHDQCIARFWDCHDSYKKTLETVGNYNKFLQSTCSERAKNLKADEAAAAARRRAKQIEDYDAKRDKR
jgi:hypothetical protein